MESIVHDADRCYRAVQSRDTRFDGWFVTAVRTTRIYCRPSCPAITPRRENVRFYATAATAQQAGYRACKRCRPDAAPGSPAWNARGDLVGRAMRLIADGVVDRDGVRGLAGRLGYSERQLHRQLVAEVGAGPIALARAQRAQTARVLIETTTMPFSEVAFGAGFASIRQFNDTIRAVFAASPTEMRTRSRHRDTPGRPGAIELRLAHRAPFDGRGLLAFFGTRAVPGLENFDGTTYCRSMVLPHGPGVVQLAPAHGYVHCRLHLHDVRDLAAAVQRCRRMLDLDADPVAVADQLGADPVLAAAVSREPGRRLPGHVDGFEIAVRAVLGQQVSVAAARTLAGRIVARHGVPLTMALDGPLETVSHTFPSPEALVDAHLDGLGLTGARIATIHELAKGVAAGRVVLDPGVPRSELEAELVALPGVGPWTAGYIAMRALSDPDVFLAADLGVRRALERAGLPARPAEAAALAERWRPWRSYALVHLWSTLEEPR
ncbi:MAG TPA: AlkA N-terminal domain-containing protein [Acidimicrobiales bacterium]|nr:AlkA N-terminal domain-containing protein [Acidimicrobiales bacterium]